MPASPSKLGRGGGIEEVRARLAEAHAEAAAYVSAVSAADVGAEAFGLGARQRRAAIEDAEDQLRTLMAQRDVLPGISTGAEAWETLDGGDRNRLLRALLSAVVVAKAGRGRRVPVEDRVRVVAHGGAVAVPRRRGGEATGIHPIDLPDADAEGVLRAAA